MEKYIQPLIYDELKYHLAPRKQNAHKGDYGHVLVIGGDYGMAGAVRLAGEAAARVGAGLTSVATRSEHVATVTCARPELMCHPITKVKQLIPLLERATVIALGPGLGQSRWSKKLFFRALATNLSLVVDADGLNLLAQYPQYRANWILTPHPGEAARLLKCDVDVIQNNRLAAASAIQRQFGGICILKGAGTLIIDQQQAAKICLAGNPGMASGGMGDILTGIVASLAAQHLPLEIAAQLGVELHAQAGDRAAKVGMRGLLATDLLNELRDLINP